MSDDKSSDEVIADLMAETPAPITTRQVTAYLHNRGYIHVTGTSVSIDLLWPILIDAPIVKGLVMYEGEGHGEHITKLAQLNYTTLKAMRTDNEKRRVLNDLLSFRMLPEPVRQYLTAYLASLNSEEKS